MAECEYCRQIMNNSDGCTYEYVAFADKPEKLFPRDRTHFDEELGKCRGCGAIHGNIHHFGCDVEKCPKCGGQLAFNCCYKERLLFWVFSFKDEDLV
jgi:hypothetical protein